MSNQEKHAWLSLAAMCGIFWWFQMRMLDGLSVADQPASKLPWIYFVVISLSTAAEIGIASLFALGRGGRPEKDERDHAIAARANQNERLFVIIAVNIVIWQALWEGAIKDHRFPHINLTDLPTLFFVLFAILFGGEVMKRVSTIWLHRLSHV